MTGPEEQQTNFERHDFEQHDFEQKLMRAMRRVNPPANFANAVMQRAQSEAQPRARVLAMPTRWRTMQAWAAGAVAATLLLGIGAQHMHHERERAQATRNFEVATQIEQQALEHTREKLSRSGISLDSQ